MKKLIMMLAAVLLPLALSAREDALAEAAKAYNDSDYVRAVGIWQAEIKEKGADAAILYNLGNAYLRMENYGAAILNYRKALKFDPHNSQAKSNLRYAEHQVAIANEVQLEDKNFDPTPKPQPFMRRVRNILESPGSNTLAWSSGVLFVIFCVAGALYVFSSEARRKKIGFFSALAAFSLSGVALILSFTSRLSAEKVEECVLMAPVASLKEEPAASAKDVATPLTGGTQLRIIGRSHGSEKGDSAQWTKVYLNDDFTGWIPSSDVEEIKI